MAVHTDTTASQTSSSALTGPVQVTHVWLGRSRLLEGGSSSSSSSSVPHCQGMVALHKLRPGPNVGAVCLPAGCSSPPVRCVPVLCSSGHVIPYAGQQTITATPPHKPGSQPDAPGQPVHTFTVRLGGGCQVVIDPLNAGSMGMMVNCAHEEACNLQAVYTQRGRSPAGVQVRQCASTVHSLGGPAAAVGAWGVTAGVWLRALHHHWPATHCTTHACTALSSFMQGPTDTPSRHAHTPPVTHPSTWE